MPRISQRLGGQLDALPFAGAFLELAGHVEAGAGRHLFDVRLIAGHVGADHDLQVGEATAVVQLDEREPLLGIATSADPAGDFQRLAGLPLF